MSAAIVQGVMETTMDADFWIDLPPRQYMRVQNLARDAGCTVGANTVVFGEVDGLGSFDKESKLTRKLKFHGKQIPVLKLERILKSKETIRRDKDLAHIVQIRQLLRCQRSTQKIK